MKNEEEKAYKHTGVNVSSLKKLQVYRLYYVREFVSMQEAHQIHTIIAFQFQCFSV